MLKPLLYNTSIALLNNFLIPIEVKGLKGYSILTTLVNIRANIGIYISTITIVNFYNISLISLLILKPKLV